MTTTILSKISCVHSSTYKTIIDLSSLKDDSHTMRIDLFISFTNGQTCATSPYVKKIAFDNDSVLYEMFFLR